jgi:hypothetical protein
LSFRCVSWNYRQLGFSSLTSSESTSISGVCVEALESSTAHAAGSGLRSRVSEARTSAKSDSWNGGQDRLKRPGRGSRARGSMSKDIEPFRLIWHQGKSFNGTKRPAFRTRPR